MAADNPLLKNAPMGRVRLSPLEIVAQGNAIIASVGRRDIEWVLRDGHPVMQWREKRVVDLPTRADLA
jgi:hypothetical protein